MIFMLPIQLFLGFIALIFLVLIFTPIANPGTLMFLLLGLAAFVIYDNARHRRNKNGGEK